VKRREFITLLGCASVAWPLAARAQQSKIPTIGFLGTATPSTMNSRVAAFVQRLRELGWIENRTVAIEYRWAEGRKGEASALPGALGLKRERLCFHSFRHIVAEALEAAAVSQTDAARVLGHTVAGMSYRVYSSGPGLKRLAAVVEEIAYPGLAIPKAEA
jgi:hypothetical protein